MKNTVGLRLVASTLVLAMTTVGCKPAATRPAAFSAKAAAGAEQRAARFYAKAQEAVQQERLADALAAAEQAVELSPRDTGYRMMLADLYLKNGRFVSAETAFSDVLTLDPGNSRASLSRVLVLIAQGRTGEAGMALDTLASSAAPADLGLAYALAGQAERAVEMLEAAARAPGATGRVRQNLALAYALSGDWQKARVVAAQDLSPAELGSRLEQWAAFSNPSAPYTQVATLLGVTPVEDAGQPVRLALAPAQAEPAQAYAAAEVPAVQAPQPPVPPVNVPVAAPLVRNASIKAVALPAAAEKAEPVRAAVAPVPLAQPQVEVGRLPVYAEAAIEPARLPVVEPVRPAVAPIPLAEPQVEVGRLAVYAEAAIEPSSLPVPEPVETFSAPVVKSVDSEIKLASAVPARPAPRVKGAQFAAAVRSLVEAPAPVVRASTRIASKPVRAFERRTPAPKTFVPKSSGGRYVVQIGAFRTAAQVEQAWAKAQRRYGFGNAEPLSTTVTIPGKGLFHRLAISGFDSAADAKKLCQSIRSQQGACFVRATAGDAPVQWASRYVNRNA